MKVWVLEYYCSDDNNYQLGELFVDYDNILGYLTETYPGISFVSEHDNGTIKIWRPDYFVPEPDFIAFEKELR
jgi:hypothetical protein